MQKNTDVDLRSSSLERPVGKTGPLPASGNLALGVFPVNSEPIRLVHSAYFLFFFTNDRVYFEKMLSSGRLEFWYTLGRGWLLDQSPVKATGTESPMNFSGK